MLERPPKTAVLVGAGMVARIHIAAVAAADKLRLLTIVSRTREHAVALASEASAKLGYEVSASDDLEAVAAQPADIAIVVTPPNARATLIKPLVKAGKHILLEKPVARNTREALDVVDLCREAGVQLGIVFQHRMRAASQKAAELVASGTLGALGVCEITVPWWRDQSYYDEPGRGTYDRDGGGVLISQDIHTIDLALSLTGPVEQVRAMASTTRFHQMESEDYVVAGLKFRSSAVGSLIASTASYPGTAESITLHYDNASLRIASGVLRVDWRDGRSESFGAEATTGGGADPMAFTHEWHQGVIEDFVDAIIAGHAPLVSGDDALASHRLIDAIIRSAQTGTQEDLTL